MPAIICRNLSRRNRKYNVLRARRLPPVADRTLHLHKPRLTAASFLAHKMKEAAN